MSFFRAAVIHPLPEAEGGAPGTGDPREAVEERYGNYDKYRKRFAAACDDLVVWHYLLKEDAGRLLAGREKLRELFPVSRK
ncbi:MAG TPA: hypothetical protein VKA46_11535 [Gemmataceae bacterium]|nr:hypothetical protein [Gemmataceae bacterium]